MANNSHFPSLEGTLTVLFEDGRVKERHELNKISGRGEITAQVHDPEGNLVSEQVFPFQSFVANMAKILLASFEEITAADTTVQTIDTAGAGAYTRGVDCTGPANDDTYGIIVGANDSGTGYLPAMSTSVNRDDYNLRRQFAEGTGTDEFTHGLTAITYTNGNPSFVMSRTFTNGSGATITVKELGVVGDDTAAQVMVVRDTIEDVVFPYSKTGNTANITVTVPDTNVLTVTYSFSVDDADGILNGWLGMVASTLEGGAQTCGTVEINTSSTNTSLDFYANPAYKDWKAAGAVEDQGFLVGTGTASTSRSAYQLMNNEQTVTHNAQTAGTITYPTPNGYDSVSNNNGDWYVYKVYVGATRSFTNTTGSAIALTEGSIVVEGSGSTVRVPIVRFKFPSTITLNDTETLSMDLKISMITTSKTAAVD